MNKTSPEIYELKRRLEAQVKRKMKTPNDFIFLSGVIWERTHETISPTTLKRLWGYISGADQARDSTLNILSRTLGFNDWDDFVWYLGDAGGSALVQSAHITAEDLRPGDRVLVSWKPDRRCIFRYLGNARFEVEASTNSKLREGDTFTTTIFILGEPLYLSKLIQGNNPPVAFVVGNKDGLTELRQLPD